MFEKQFKEMEEIVSSAIDYLESGDMTKVKSLVKKLNRYHPTTEQDRYIAIVESLMLLKRKKKRQAKHRILINNYAAWGSADLLDILRMCNPPVDKDSRSFFMTIEGGLASFGAFTQFSDEHMCDLEIIANSKSEAFEYARELCNFAQPEAARIVHFELSESPPDLEEYRGVVSTSPFRTERDEELQSPLADSLN